MHGPLADLCLGGMDWTLRLQPYFIIIRTRCFGHCEAKARKYSTHRRTQRRMGAKKQATEEFTVGPVPASKFLSSCTVLGHCDPGALLTVYHSTQ